MEHFLLAGGLSDVLSKKAAHLIVLVVACCSCVSIEDFITGTVPIKTLVSKGGLISGFERTYLCLVLISLKLMQLCKSIMRSLPLVKQLLVAYSEKKKKKKKHKKKSLTEKTNQLKKKIK